MKIIINADDFGYDQIVNTAIADAFNRGWITNTTIMVNMGGVSQAIEIAKEEGFIDRVGLHLNLFEGEPLTEKMKNDPFFAENGELTSFKMFHQLSSKYKFYLPGDSVSSLMDEIDAQMKKYVDLGLGEMHLDSHGHSHTFLSVYRIIRTINKKYGFKTIRLSLNMYLKRKTSIRLYKNAYNHMLHSGFHCTDYFTSAAEFIEVAKSMQKKDGSIVWSDKYRNSICEIMVHPTYDEQGRLINHGGPSFEQLMEYLRDVEMISYNDL